MCVCVCVRVCRARARACVCVCVCNNFYIKLSIEILLGTDLSAWLKTTLCFRAKGSFLQPSTDHRITIKADICTFNIKVNICNVLSDYHHLSLRVLQEDQDECQQSQRSPSLPLSVSLPLSRSLSLSLCEHLRKRDIKKKTNSKYCLDLFDCL